MFIWFFWSPDYVFFDAYMFFSIRDPRITEMGAECNAHWQTNKFFRRWRKVSDHSQSLDDSKVHPPATRRRTPSREWFPYNSEADGNIPFHSETHFQPARPPWIPVTFPPGRDPKRLDQSLGATTTRELLPPGPLRGLNWRPCKLRKVG